MCHTHPDGLPPWTEIRETTSERWPKPPSQFRRAAAARSHCDRGKGLKASPQVPGAFACGVWEVLRRVSTTSRLVTVASLGMSQTVPPKKQTARVSGRHIWYFLHGKRRASANLLGIIRAALGEAGWAFATSQTDILRDEGGDHARRDPAQIIDAWWQRTRPELFLSIHHRTVSR